MSKHFIAKSSMRLALSTAVAFACAGIPAVSVFADPTDPTIGQQVDQAGKAASDGANRVIDRVTGTTQPSGPMVSDSEAKAVRKVLADITDAAVTKGGFSSIVSRLNEADRTRIGKDKNLKWDDLDQAAAQVQQDFKDKYNQSFKIKDTEAVFNQVAIYQGDIADQARLAGDRITPDAPPMNMPAGNNSNPSNSNPTNGQIPVPVAPTPADPSAPTTPSNDNSQSIRVNENLATAYFPGTGDLPAVGAHLSNEGTITRSWKIDLPQQFTAQQLHDNLLKHFQGLHDARATWPADANEAYRVVANHVFIALYNADSPTMTPGITGSPATPNGIDGRNGAMAK